ncbi:MAG: hypothetical protein LUC16_01090 [Coprobacillus sp.]|nr:hypothetical protein [Coprobacillus sp.]
MKKTILSVALLACLSVGLVTACDSSSEDKANSFAIANKSEMTAEWHYGEASRDLEFESDPVMNPTQELISESLVIVSSDTSVVTVSGYTVSVVGEGTSTVTATWRGLSDSVEITITAEALVDIPWTVGTEYYLGVPVTDEAVLFATGDTVSNYSYEGVVSPYVSDAVKVTISRSEHGGAGLVLSLEGGKYLNIVNGEHVNLEISTTKGYVYYNPTYQCLGNAEGTYFLSYNSTYGCLYVSEVASWIESAPTATFYETESATDAPAPREHVTSLDNIETATYTLGIYHTGKYAIYYMTGEMSGFYGATSTDESDAIICTVSAATGTSTYGVAAIDSTGETETKYTISFTKNSTTYYVGLKYNDTHNNLTFVAESSTSSAITEFSWDSTYDCFTAPGSETGSSSTVFLGTYGSYSTIGWYNYSYISQHDEYPIHLYSVTTTTPEQ